MTDNDKLDATNNSPLNRLLAVRHIQQELLTIFRKFRKQGPTTHSVLITSDQWAL